MLAWISSFFRPAESAQVADIEAAYQPKVLNLQPKPQPQVINKKASVPVGGRTFNVIFGIFTRGNPTLWWQNVKSFIGSGSSRLTFAVSSLQSRIAPADPTSVTKSSSAPEMIELPLHAPRATVPSATRQPSKLAPGMACSTPLPTPPSTPLPTGPYYQICDLVSYMPYKLDVNPFYQPVADISEKWLDDHKVHSSAKKRAGFEACNFGLLTAFCYPDSDYERFRVLCDYINALFAYDDLADEGGLREDGSGCRKAGDIIMNALHYPFTYETEFRCGQIFASFWARAREIGIAAGTQRRFLEYTDLYVQAVHEQVINRAKGHIPDLESWITLRRDTGALKMCFAMGEFAQNIDLPDEVFECHLIKIMEDCANDIVVMTNDIYSYNIEQAQGDTCNIIEVAMKEKHLDVQGAMDYAAELVKGRVDLYISSKAQLPSWGPRVDADVQKYCRIMEAWDIGGCIWSLESKRYFGDKVDQVRKTLCVEILPKELPRGQMAIPDLERA